MDNEIYRGVLTGFNEAFVVDGEKREELIDEDPKSEEILKPLVIGKDIKRYHVKQRDRWLIWTYRGVDIDRYPAIYEHLEQYREQLEDRWDKGDHWWELRPCDYYDEFEKPKLMLPDIAERAAVYWDTEGLFGRTTVNFMPQKDPGIVALMNFLVVSAWYGSESAVYRGGYLRFKREYLVHIPIRRTSFTTPKKERENEVEKLKNLYREAVSPSGPVGPTLT